MLRFPLHDHRPGQDLAAVNDVTYPKIHEVAAAQLAVDREIKHSQIPHLVCIL